MYERGEFTHESTIATAAAFIIYSLGILGYLAQELINKVMYLASKYLFTIVGTVLVVGAKVILNSILVNGSQNGTFIASLTTTVLLTLYALAAFMMLKKIIGNYLSKSVVISIIKIFISGGVAVAVYFILKIMMPGIVTATSPVFALPILICGIVYIACIIILGLHKQLIRNPKKERSENN